VEVCDCGEDISRVKPLRKRKSKPIENASGGHGFDYSNILYFNPSTVVLVANLIFVMAIILMVVSIVMAFAFVEQIGAFGFFVVLFSAIIQFLLLLAVSCILRMLMTIAYNTRC